MQWLWQIPVPSVLIHRGLVIFSQFVIWIVCADTSLISFSPSAVLVTGQNLLCRCCSPMYQYSINMVTHGHHRWWELFVLPMSWKHFLGGKLNVEWIHLQVAPHLPAMFSRIEHANDPLPVSFFPATVDLWILAFQNCLCLLIGFGFDCGSLPVTLSDP